MKYFLLKQNPIYKLYKSFLTEVTLHFKTLALTMDFQAY